MWQKIQQLVINNPIGNQCVRFIGDNPVYKGALVLGGGTVLAQAVGILSMPVITRLYLPSDLGILAVFSSILAIVAGIATFRYEFAFPLPKEEDCAANLFVLTLILLTVTTVFFGLIVLFAGEFLISVFHFTSLSPYMGLLVIGFFGTGLYTLLNHWAIRQREYRRITFTKINQGVSGAACKIFLGLFSFGPFGLIIGNIISQVAGIGTFARAMWRDERKKFTKISFQDIRESAKKFSSFPAYNCPGLIISTISLQLPPLLLLSMYNVQVVGFYALAQGLLVLPGSMISSSVAQAFHGEVGNMVRQGSVELHSFHVRTVKHLATVALPLIGIPSLLAPFLFPIIFGEVWTDAGWYCLPLAIMVMAGFVAATTNKLDVYGCNHWVLMITIIQLAFVLIGFFSCNLLKLPVLLTLTVYSIIMAIMYGTVILLNIKAISRITESFRT